MVTRKQFAIHNNGSIELAEKKKWSRKYEKCLNCESAQFKHRAKGFCVRCYPLIKKIEAIKKWNFSERSTNNMVSHIQDKKIFNEVKTRIICQIEKRLHLFKSLEEINSHPIDGLDIEYRLRDIALRCRTRDKDLFHGIAGYIDESFNTEQKRILYKLLNKIISDIPWGGINWSKVFFGLK